MEIAKELSRLLLTVIFRTPFMEIHKLKELQIMVEIRGSTRCSVGPGVA